MQVTVSDRPSESANQPARAALEFVHRVLTRTAADHPDLPGLLAELVQAFAAESAGIADLADGKVCLHFPPGATVRPPSAWREDSTLVGGCQRFPVAVTLEDDGVCRLAAAVTDGQGGWLFWLEAGRRASFSESEAAAFSMAAHALIRWLSRDPQPRWAEQLNRAARQNRLEVIAEVTRRLSHDFGNILTGILGFTELALGQQIPAGTPLHSHLQEAFRAAQAGAQFTHQLRLFSRRQLASSRSSSLAAVLAEQEARLFAAQPNGLNFRSDLPADLPPVAADAEYLHLVLTALLDNAREAFVGPGSINVSARVVELTAAGCLDLFGSLQPGTHVEVVVADTGAGLSPEASEKLFADPFFTTKARRRGFGLAVAYGILHAHRGGLRLYPGEDRGVVVRVLLPVSRQPALAFAEQPAAAEQGARVRGERILVVDDEIDVLNYVSSALVKNGYRVEAVSSGEAAVQAYFAQPNDPFRLVLTDVVMPGITGVELIRRLQRRDPAVRVLFMSGHVTGEFSQQNLGPNNPDMLAKPFRTELLTRAVRAAIDRQARRGTAREPGAATSCLSAVKN